MSHCLIWWARGSGRPSGLPQIAINLIGIIEHLIILIPAGTMRKAPLPSLSDGRGYDVTKVQVSSVLPVNLQAKLHITSGKGGGYHAKTGNAEGCCWCIELWVVEGVKHFSPKFNCPSFPLSPPFHNA